MVKQVYEHLVRLLSFYKISNHLPFHLIYVFHVYLARHDLVRFYTKGQLLYLWEKCLPLAWRKLFGVLLNNFAYLIKRGRIKADKRDYQGPYQGTPSGFINAANHS